MGYGDHFISPVARLAQISQQFAYRVSSQKVFPLATLLTVFINVGFLFTQCTKLLDAD
jgi:hypothetical protein